MRLPILFLASIALLLSCQSSMAKDCFGALRKPLTEGQYSGGMDCEKVRVDIKRVGTISVGSEHYTIYNLHYKTVPEFPGAQSHGGQRILIFAGLGEKTYLGQYSITPWHELRVVGASLESDFSTLEGNEIFFAAGGPPEKIHFGGDVLEFYK